MIKRTKTDFILIHHSGISYDKNPDQYEANKRYHIGKGWQDLGYHAEISKSGKIHKGRRLDLVGAHCKYGGYNFKSVGVCIDGNFCTGQDKPTKAQLKSLTKVLDGWSKKYKIPKKDILGHRQTKAKTACPGIGLIDWLKEYRFGIIEEEMTKLECFRYCFITVAGRWPDEEEIKEWKKSNNEIYTYVQQTVPDPLRKKLKNEIEQLRRELKQSHEYLEGRTKDVAELEKKLKELKWYLKGREVKPVNNVTKESLKELARVLLFALVSFGIAKLSSLPETETTVIGLALLRTADKVIHLIGKETGNEKLITGLSRF